jgi:ABC-type nitrate/sulfonate/bicarbonate transport system substrate-binding protein
MRKVAGKQAERSDGGLTGRSLGVKPARKQARTMTAGQMKRVASAVAAVVLLLSLVSCAKGDVGGEGYSTNVVRINVPGAYTAIVFQTIKLVDLLTPLLPEGVSVEWSNMQLGTDSRDAALAGRLDIFSLSISEAILSSAAGHPFVLLSNQSVGYVQIFSTKEHIRGIEDLTPSSRIAVSGKTTVSHFVFALHCKEVFGDPLRFDNNLVAVPAADAIGLMQTSQDYDAFIFSFPHCHMIPGDVEYHSIADLSATALKYSVGSYIYTTESFMRDNPVIVDAFREACRQAVELLTGDTDNMAVRLSGLYGVGASDIAEVLRRCPPSLEMFGYDEMADIMLEIGFLSQPAKRFADLPHYDEIPKR